MKICYKCKDTKNLSDFPNAKGMKDSHLNMCDGCVSLYMKQYKILNKEIIQKKRKEDRILNRAYYNNKNLEYMKRNLEKCSLKLKAYRLKNPEKYKSHTAVNNALKSGKLKKPSNCEKCNNPKIHGHHDDYTKPLDVIWLCAIHHRERHEELKVGGK